MKTLLQFFLLLLAGNAMAYEEPKYTVILQTDKYEIREYEPYLVAETTVQGDFENSGNRAFRILAGYIFGNNQSSLKMEMTAPVTREEKTASSVKMNMTAPVLRQLVDTQVDEETPSEFVYHFVMESKYTMDSLPIPNDPRVRLKEVPGETVAVKRYSGRWSASNYEKHKQQLLNALDADQITIIGEPKSAAYNGPFTPPFLRRNEILVSVQKTAHNTADKR